MDRHMTHTPKILAGIDAGGTSFKVGLADMAGQLIARTRVPTGDPERTLKACADFLLSEAAAHGGVIIRLGIASFGPVDINPTSVNYGTILTTPKPGWSKTPLRAILAEKLGVAVCVDTDVNGALLAEMENGAAADVSSAAYVTIGTGIGAGIFTGGGLIGKPNHPEFGHIRLARHPDDTFDGACPFHGDCLEGLASAPAFTTRFGDPAGLPPDHKGWQMEAFYLAQACWSLSMSFRVERILLGGGLMLAPLLIDLVRQEYLKLAGGYLGQDREKVDNLIMRPAHGDDAGLLGGLYLARRSSGPIT